jgi:hypothetical protein
LIAKTRFVPDDVDFIFLSVGTIKTSGGYITPLQVHQPGVISIFATTGLLGISFYALFG